MNLLFAPAVAIMNRLRFSAKMALLGLVVVGVTTFLMLQMLNSLSAQREQVSNEFVGLDYTRPLYGVMLGMQQHRGLANAMLNGDGSVRDALNKKQAEVDAALKSLDDVGRANEALLGHAAASAKIVQGWSALKSELTQLAPKASFTRHSELIESTIVLLRDSAERSQLMLDPNYASYESDRHRDQLPSATDRVQRAPARPRGRNHCEKGINTRGLGGRGHPANSDQTSVRQSRASSRQHRT